MAPPKHYLIEDIGLEDRDAWVYCGTETGDNSKFTTNKNLVTCKRCLKRIKKNG